MWKHTLVAASVVVLCYSSRSVSVPTAGSDSGDKVDTAVSDSSLKDYQIHNENVNQLDDDEPVRYDGAQVWRLGFTDIREKNAVSDLQHNFGNNPAPQLGYFLGGSSTISYSVTSCTMCDTVE